MLTPIEKKFFRRTAGYTLFGGGDKKKKTKKKKKKKKVELKVEPVD